MADVGAAASGLVSDWNNTISKVSVKAVGIQMALMTGISIATVLAFSFFRPREKKVYAPKIKYQLPPPAEPLDDPDYEPPPPPISNSFWAWLSPVIHLKEEQTTANVGLDAATFLRFLRLLRHAFTVISLFGAALLAINIIYNLKYVPSNSRNFLSLLTIANVKGSWMWPALAASYVFNFVVMYFSWRNWKAMTMLRYRWFRSPAYQTKIYSRTLMITQIPKPFRSDAGLVGLMGKLKVDGIKIGPEIDCATIGRQIGDFPELVEEHNKAVADLEKYLCAYLRDGKMAHKRPTLRKGGFLGMGGQKHDAIDYLAKEIRFLREKIDTRRQAIESLRRQERRAWKYGKEAPTRVEGENYGFVTFKTISEAHRIARTHHAKQKELGGARLQLAQMPQDIVWQNISREPAQIRSRIVFGFIILGVVCFLNTIPLLIVSLLANLSYLTAYVGFLSDWSHAGQWGNWTFSIVSGVLPSMVSFVFGYLLPIIIRSVSRFQGAQTRSRLDRATTARYFAFIVISNLIVFSLLGVFYGAVAEVVVQIGKHNSAFTILNGLKNIPYEIQGTYVQQSTYWLTWLPLRGFLVIFELIQLIKLALVSIRRYMFKHTPRDIREMTKPEYFDYPVVTVNLLFVVAVGMIYAPLAPLVAMGACIVFWFSSIVYKYQLLYVWISRAESGGRMWNVYVNRLLATLVLMQLLMILTTGLIRRRWLDTIAAVPPILLLVAFKIWIKKVFGDQFRYYSPSPQEAEQERRISLSEKRTKISEMERRFLHPALQHDKLFKVMVHKSQEELARDVLAAYPWFADKQHGGLVNIKGVREENLEYDPSRDGPRDEAHQNDWETRSQGSTDMLAGMSTSPSTPATDLDMFKSYPPTTGGTIDSPEDYKSPFGVPSRNPSTDYLLGQQARDADSAEMYHRQQRYAQGMGFQSRSQDSLTGYPLLQHAIPIDQEPGRNPYSAVPPGAQAPSRSQSDDQGVPYPPSAYSQPPPLGYTPPLDRRSSNDSLSDETRVERMDSQSEGSDVGNGRRQAGIGGLPPGARNGYPDTNMHLQGSTSSPAQTGPVPLRQGSAPSNSPANPYAPRQPSVSSLNGQGGARISSPLSGNEPYPLRPMTTSPQGSLGYPSRYASPVQAGSASSLRQTSSSSPLGPRQSPARQNRQGNEDRRDDPRWNDPYARYEGR